MKAERRRSTSAFGDRFPEFCSVVCIGPRGSGIDFSALSASNKPVESLSSSGWQSSRGRQAELPQNWGPLFVRPRGASLPSPPSPPLHHYLCTLLLFLCFDPHSLALPPCSSPVPSHCGPASSPFVSLSLAIFCSHLSLALSPFPSLPKWSFQHCWRAAWKSTAAKVTFSFKGKACISNCSLILLHELQAILFSLRVVCFS